MGRKLDMSNLTEEEAEHVLQVVQRDMQLRKAEEERLSELKQELDQEESRCVLLSRQRGFNERCCIRCCSSFTFFLKKRRRCLDCRYNVCKRCCSYSETDKSWLCSACEKSRLLKTQSLEWFYSNVRRRFKRFGSAKVLKMLYRRHVGDQGSQAEFTGVEQGSTYAESTDDSVYESDSTFYQHTEERSMAESISVALRVAKEAIDEAITKAEKQTGNQEKLKEACYLRDNRGELIEELTTMIVQTIICKKRDLSEMHTECNLESPPDQNSNKSQSAFSRLTDEILTQHDKAEQSSMLCTQGLKMDEVPAVASWNLNMDWMENSCASSVLQSPDGNWFALQSTQLSRLSLPTKRENLMFSALEKESGVISAYDGMVSDTESDSDGAWDAAQLEIHGTLSSSNLLNDHHAASSQPAIKLPTKNTDDQPQTDSDQNNRVPQIHKSSLPLLKRKVSLEDRHLSCQCCSAMGISANPDGGESSEDGLEDNRVKRTRRRKRNKHEATEGKSLRVCGGERLSLSEPQDYGRMLLNYLLKCQSKRQSVSEFPSDETMNADTPHSVTPDILKSGAMTPVAFTSDVEDPNTEHHFLSSTSDQQLTSKLRELANQVNGTQLPLTRNGLDGEEEPVDERNEKRERGKKEERGRESREALCDMEVDVDQEDSEMKEDKDNEIENKKLRNSENLSTNMIDNMHNEILQETVEKQSAFEMERTARMPQKECCFDCKFEVFESANNTDSDGQIKSTEDKANYMSERIHVDQNVEQGKKDRSESRGGEDTEPEPVKKQQSVKNEAHIEPEVRSLLEIDKQRETPVESCEKSEKVESQECRKATKDTEYAAESKKDSLDNTGSEKRMNEEKERLTYSQDILDFGEEGDSEYKKMIENVVKGLNIMEEETEAHISNTRYSISDFTEELSKEKEEIMRKQKEQNQMTPDNEIGFHNERMNRDEHTRESDMENESRGNLVEKTEEHSFVAEAEQCNDHTLKDVLDFTPSGQEEFLSPEEIYKDVHLEKDLQFVFTLLQQKYSAASLRSITTEVLKVLNATEDLIQGAMGLSQSESWDRSALPPTQSKRLDEQLSRLEENVYVAASAIFGLEAELGDLEECARSISGETTEEELSQLEEQVASAAAQVQQSELQVSDIAARIAALKNAGLNVAPQTRFAKPQTIDSSRQHRRRLPAPPMQGKRM
ncbi:rab effector MyRIP isoform X1 [Pangasianodon hypophthalmus]|uniref:rab effector MyRIP isoform X1 n=1 Tax=Pangasianodon hypophthalmus TaxID=310915 RepID=UPI002307E106|nr:rab effector MyRIP isoform X1 [Pangasianodon hypophthalmus]